MFSASTSPRTNFNSNLFEVAKLTPWKCHLQFRNTTFSSAGGISKLQQPAILPTFERHLVTHKPHDFVIVDSTGISVVIIEVAIVFLAFNEDWPLIEWMLGNSKSWIFYCVSQHAWLHSIKYSDRGILAPLPLADLGLWGLAKTRSESIAHDLQLFSQSIHMLKVVHQLRSYQTRCRRGEEEKRRRMSKGATSLALARADLTENGHDAGGGVEDVKYLSSQGKI